MITVAILGSGFMGSAHAANYKALGERVRVKTIASRTAEQAARVAEVVGADVTADLDGAIHDPEVEAVDICLPTPLHREYAERALAAGKSVFLEKPIALTTEDAEAIVAAAARSDAVFMVGMVLRFWPEYVELQRLVAAGQLGRPRAVSTFRLSPPADWNDWMAERSQSGGTPVDLMIHDLDQMNWLLGIPRSVYASEPTSGSRARSGRVRRRQRRRGGKHVDAALVSLHELDPRPLRERRRRVRLLRGARGRGGQHRRVLVGEGPTGVPPRG